MDWSEYLGGFAVFALMAAGVIAGAVILARRRLPELRGVTRVLAVALLSTLGVLVVHLVPGMLGVLARGSVLLSAAAWLVAALFVRPVAREPEPARPAPASGRLALALGAIGGLAAVAFVIAFVRDQLVLAPGSVDILNFHLPGIASWIQEGSIWQVHEFVADISPGRYPQNGDVILLAAVLPWHSDFLSHVLPAFFLVLTALATYALSVELGAPRAAAATAGALVITLPIVALPALVNSFPDVVLLFTFATGLLFLLRHRRTGATSDLVLAGLGLGVAFGTKWYGPPAVAAAFAVWAGGSLLERVAPRVVVRRGLALAGLIALAAGPWFLRNLLESGNPVHPAEVSLLGVTIFPAPVDTVREAAGFTIASYFGDWAAWTDYILPQYRNAYGLAGPLTVAGLVAVAGALALPRLRALIDAGLLAAGLLLAVLIALLYSLTPYTGGGAEGMPTLVYAGARYLVPALVVALAVIAAVTPIARWAAALFCGLGLIAIADGIRLAGRGELSGGTLEPSDWLVALAVLAIAGLAVLAWRRGPAGLRARPALAATACGCVAVLCVAGYEMQQSFLTYRYRGVDATADWLLNHAPAGATVGLAGRWTDAWSPALTAFGPRFENEVSYVGEYVEGTLRAYPTQEEFTRTLRERGVELLFVGRGRPPQDSVREGEWARAAGYELVARSDTINLYSVLPREGEEVVAEEEAQGPG